MIWLLLYAFFLCLLSIYARHKDLSKISASFFVNNRQSSANAVALSIVASCVGGSATLGVAGLAWQVGTPAFWWLGTSAMGLCILAFFLARKVRQSNAFTLPQMVSTFLGQHARPLTSIIIILAWLAITSAQLSAMAALILPLMPDALNALPSFLSTYLNGFDHFSLSLLLGSCIVIVYACIGGQSAIIKSDAVQYVIMMISLIVALFLLLSNINHAGLQNPLNAVPLEFVNSDFPISKFTYFLFIIGGSYVICPMLFGRLYSAKNSQVAKRGAILAVVWLVLTAILIVIIGITCRAFVSADVSNLAPEKILTAVLFEQLPPWARVLAFLGIFSALISSTDSSLFTAASICSNDIFKKQNINLCRICIVIIGIFSMMLALSGKGILQLLLMANDIYVCGVVAPVFVGMILHPKYKFNAHGISLAIIAGGGFGLTAALSGNNLYSYLGLAAATLVSLLAIQKPQSLSQKMPSHT